MSGRYEVTNRYSAYIDARRSYLEQSDSEEDVEIRTILRRPQAYLRRTVSSSSEEQPTATPAMVLVPTVTIQEAPKEVEIAPSTPEDKPSSSLHEIYVESAIEEVAKPEAAPSCDACTNVQDFVKTSFENLKTKTQKVVDFLLDPALHATIRSEFLQYFPTFLIGFAVFLFFITSVSIFKLIKNGAHSEPSLFCRYFSGPFAPLFDALCAPEPFNFSEELSKIMGGLVDEMLLTISEFLRTIAKGFSVFGTLFTAIGNGLSNNLSFGCHELGENLGENIAHLIHFIFQFFHQILHFFLSIIATIAGGIAGVFTSLHDYLEPPRGIW